METETRNPTTESRLANSNSHTSTTSRSIAVPSGWHAGPFDHQRLDAFWVALEALVLGDLLARQLPRGYGSLADQLRRALLHAHVGVAEAAARTGADREARFRAARGETGEAAAALQAVGALGLASRARVEPVIALLARLCAMLTRLAGLRGPA